MQLFLDVGHQRIKYGTHNGKRWIEVRYCSADPSTDHLPIHKGVSAVWVASVRNQQYNHALLTFLTKAYSCTLHFAHACQTLGDYKSLYAPQQLGVDRFLAGVAAYRQIAATTIVVDYGTALTIDAIDNDGCHRGGLIMPGANMLQRALADRVGLPAVQLTNRPTYFAVDTNGAIDGGCSLMLSAAVQAAIRAMQKELDGHVTVVLTGGDAALLHWPDDWTVHSSPHLVLDGLYIYAQQKTHDQNV